uniref:HTH_Tnp_Tc3_1 domain-containing protein n=1 Tax=Heterorhabditis bacteriophora TaxID=37862 RepID=A0A1I7XSJ5_HETBA
MDRSPTLSLHERGQIKVLSTTGYTVKQIADVVKRSKKAIMNFLRHQEEYGTKKSTGRPSKLNDGEKGKFCGLRRITRSAPMKSVGLMTLMLHKLRHVQRYGTGRLGDCLDENEQRGLPGCLTTSPSPVLASLSNKTMPPSTPVETLRPG